MTSRPPCAAFGADTVAVLACPEMDGIKLRALAWELEKTGTDLCVSPALLDVAGPRTTIRPTAGLTLLARGSPAARRYPAGHQGPVRPVRGRGGADRALPAAGRAGVMIWLPDRGPALFTQIRVGKDGRVFRIYKFRTMVVDAEQRKAQLLASNDTTASCSSSARTPASPRSGRICGAGQSTSCHSFSTCSSATCRWWDRARRCRMRRRSTPSMSVAGSWSSRA